MTKHAALAFALVILVGCGGDDGDDGDDTPVIDGPAGPDSSLSDAPNGPPDSPAATFTLTSPAFAEGGVIPDENACAGANISPELNWTPGPAGTMGYAVVFTDTSPPPLVHWVIYDIGGTATGLPADVENTYAPTDVPGAHQTISYSPGIRGYLGPCPGTMHTYQFEVFALDVATLPGATMATTRAQAVAIIETHDLASATLTGTFTP
jgi:Raf kinase inhibitor-like YbhB/YbcL family protein